jgi:hypothetical protein
MKIRRRNTRGLSGIDRPQRPTRLTVTPMSPESARDDIAAEIVAEMNRTDENIDDPNFEDYASDIIRRLNFIVNGES